MIKLILFYLWTDNEYLTNRVNQLKETSQNQTKLLVHLVNQHEKDVYELKNINKALNIQTISLNNILVELKNEVKGLQSGLFDF